MKRPAASTQLWSFAMGVGTDRGMYPAVGSASSLGGFGNGKSASGKLEIALALAADCGRVTVDS